LRGVGRMNCVRANSRSQLWTFIVFRRLALGPRRARDAAT
jgi:hypothetical protein